MLALEPVAPAAIDRDGFAVGTDALTAKQFAYLTEGAPLPALPF